MEDGYATEGHGYQQGIIQNRCPYYDDGRGMRVLTLTPLHAVHKTHVDVLFLNGFRRQGSFFYKPVCETCAACVPIRVPTKTYRISKSQRRTRNKNSDITVRRVEPAVTEEKVRIYTAYQKEKHESPLSEREAYQTLFDLHEQHAFTVELDYYDGKRLVGVSVLDGGVDSLSTNYFYYDAAYLPRRLGIYSASREIALAKEWGIGYYYFGFYLHDLTKMNYKARFRPNEILETDGWHPFHTH